MDPKKLLIIEDDRAARDAIQFRFISRGWEVAMAETQDQGLALLADYQPDWVVVAWEQVKSERLDRILLLLIDDVREELVNASGHHSRNASITAFELREGRLRQVKIANRSELASIKPIWVDLVSPSVEARHWVGEHFGIDLPDPESLTDLESSARFFVEDNGEIHVHSDFLLDSEGDIWVSTPRGIDRFREPNVLRLSTADGLSGDLIDAVLASRDGAIWVGTAGGGLDRVQPIAQHRGQNPHHLPIAVG